ncbi:hypothetical protein [Glycomyces harbinensis]|nr:hypothetical protein [Glycomyces harbinensis]
MTAVGLPYLKAGTLVSGYRRLTLQYEQHGHLSAGFPTLPAITCAKKLAN